MLGCGRLGCGRLVRRDDAVSDGVLRAAVRDRPQQGERSTFTVHGVLTGGKRDVVASASATLPDAKPDQLKAGQRAVCEMKLGVCYLAGRLVNESQFNCHRSKLPVVGWRNALRSAVLSRQPAQGTAALPITES